MKTVALYLRVSSVDQHPETQLYDLRAMAQQRGFQIVAEYTDRISGTKARRPGLDDLLRDARRGRFQVLLVWASDRIARSVRHFLEGMNRNKFYMHGGSLRKDMRGIFVITREIKYVFANHLGSRSHTKKRHAQNKRLSTWSFVSNPFMRWRPHWWL
jgi:predicted site-specific integrase-resolvase